MNAEQAGKRSADNARDEVKSVFKYIENASAVSHSIAYPQHISIYTRDLLRSKGYTVKVKHLENGDINTEITWKPYVSYSKPVYRFSDTAKDFKKKGDATEWATAEPDKVFDLSKPIAYLLSIEKYEYAQELQDLMDQWKKEGRELLPFNDYTE